MDTMDKAYSSSMKVLHQTLKSLQDPFQMDLLYYNAWCANHSITWTRILILWYHLTIYKCTQEHKHQLKAQRADLTRIDSFHIEKLFFQEMTQHFSWLIRSVLGAYCLQCSLRGNITSLNLYIGISCFRIRVYTLQARRVRHRYHWLDTPSNTTPCLYAWIQNCNWSKTTEVPNTQPKKKYPSSKTIK